MHRLCAQIQCSSLTSLVTSGAAHQNAHLAMFTPTLTSLSGWITTTCASLGATGRPLLAPSGGADAAGSCGEPDRSAASPLGTDGEVALVCSSAAAEAAGLPLASVVGAETGAEAVVVASITGTTESTNG